MFAQNDTLEDDDPIFEGDPADKTDDDKGEESGDDKSDDKSGSDTNKDKEEDASDRKSAIAQKKYWRDKAKKAEEKASKVEELQTELATLREAVKKPEPGDEKEAAAQKYIRDQAKSVYEELQKAKESAEKKELNEFQASVADLLEDNPDISEEELLDTIEEYEVTPKVALKILQRDSEKTTKKPKMPQQKRAGGEETKKLPDDSTKSIWQIAQEEAKRFKGE